MLGEKNIYVFNKTRVIERIIFTFGCSHFFSRNVTTEEPPKISKRVQHTYTIFRVQLIAESKEHVNGVDLFLLYKQLIARILLFIKKKRYLVICKSPSKIKVNEMNHYNRTTHTDYLKK